MVCIVNAFGVGLWLKFFLYSNKLKYTKSILDILMYGIFKHFAFVKLPYLLYNKLTFSIHNHTTIKNYFFNLCLFKIDIQLTF